MKPRVLANLGLCVSTRLLALRLSWFGQFKNNATELFHQKKDLGISDDLQCFVIFPTHFNKVRMSATKHIACTLSFSASGSQEDMD